MPKSWLLSDNKLMPYEFYFVPPVLKANNATRSCNIEFDPDFVKEFAHILDAHNLTSILGLYLLQAVEGEIVELTEGNANITFTVPSVSLISPHATSSKPLGAMKRWKSTAILEAMRQFSDVGALNRPVTK
jgi:hypothetical protein